MALSLGIFACNDSKPKEIQKEEIKTVLPADTTKKEAVKAEYECPMHPEVKSDKVIACPKCGMDLEKVEKK